MRPQKVIALFAAAAFTLALAVATGQAVAQKPRVTETKFIEISATPIAGFQFTDANRKDFGRLRWRGGLVLKSSSPDFGGWSGLVLDRDGRDFLAVSDSGAWLTGELIYDGVRPVGVRNARIGPLKALKDRPLLRLRDRDAEAVTLAQGTLRNGTILVAFEGNHRIGRFSISRNGVSGPRQYLQLPPEARRMRSNEGFEAVSVLKGGRYKGAIIALSERFKDDRGHHTGWIWVNGVQHKLHLTDIGGFNITDAAALDDGGLIVLERRFGWLEGIKMRLRLVSPEEIAPRSVMKGEVLFEANMGYQIDNLEGVAVHRGEQGETVVTLISDDNFNSLLQRTVLLQFTLKAAED